VSELKIHACPTTTSTSFCTTAGHAEPLPNPPQHQVESRESSSGPTTQQEKTKHSKGDGETTESSISWQADPQCTNKLVHFLTNNPADCRILFSSEGKKPADPDIEGPPSGKDKNAIHAVMAEAIFSGNRIYAAQYAANWIRFCDSVANHITT
jgi:hypothetical protein